MHGLVDPIELALDDAFLGLAAGSEQDFAVTFVHAPLGAHDGFGCKAERATEGFRNAVDCVVRGRPRQVERRHRERDPEKCRQSRPRRHAE